MRTLCYAPDAWKSLNGVFCIYKPSGLSTKNVRETLCFNLCRDLNEMVQRENRGMVRLKGSVYSKKPYEVELVPNYAEHELVSGSHYQLQDIRMNWVSHLGRNTSGVLLMAVNDGCKFLKDSIFRFCRKYEIKGEFGIATDNFMSHGKVIEKSSHSHVKQVSLDRVLASIQASHQPLAYKYSGVNIQSQAAYDLASSGLVKPCGKSMPIIYGIKCTELKHPHFTLEVQCINETEMFLSEVIHDIGIDLKTNAVCRQLRQTQFGHFILSHALLRKHWTLENILNNLTLCKSVLEKAANSADSQLLKSFKQNSLLEDMQNEIREECM